MTKNHLTSSEMKYIDTDCELLFVQIILKNKKNITVWSFYRPDWTGEKYTDDFAAAIAKVNPVPGLEETSTYQTLTGQQIVL